MVFLYHPRRNAAGSPRPGHEQTRMNDPRIDKLARVLVHYSLRLRKGQLIRIAGSAPAVV